MRPLLAAFALAALPGCSYLQQRADDAADMVDIGITWSNEPAFALYTNTPILVPIGWSRVDGYFAGLGGGQWGMTSLYESCSGILLWGTEQVAWHDYDVNKPETLNLQGVGPIAPMVGPFGSAAYVPAWSNYIHLGFGGLAFNARYMDMIDFILGWFGADIASDDGKTTAQWPWEDRPHPRGALAPCKPVK